MMRLAERLRLALEQGEDAVLVSVLRVAGSTPREVGARMAVWVNRLAGTIGGGRLEFEAIGVARSIIIAGGDARELEFPLGPALGQCCGGSVILGFERVSDATLSKLAALEQIERAALPSVFLFGAGHVGKAIAVALAPLPLKVVWIDSRPDQLPEEVPGEIEVVVAPDPTARVALAPPGTQFRIVTHSHTLDFALAEAVLKRRDRAFAGMIGSSTKRRRFERWYIARGGDAGDLDRLICPIGAGLERDKRPAVIAAMVAAELLLAVNRGVAPIVDIERYRRQA